jgi:CBS domain-containing protein
MAATTVGEIMSPDPFTITPQTTTEEIADIIVEKRYYSLPVVENGKLVGIVGMEDMLKRLAFD